MPEVIPFTAAHLPQAGRITLSCWGNVIADLPETLRPLIYESLAKYYFILNSPCNLAIEENGAVTTFLLAVPAEMARHFEPPFPSGCTPEDKPVLREYKAYIDSNRYAEHQVLQKDEIVMLLFASIRKGHGKRLLQELERRAVRQGARSLLLWSDETCDFGYYPRHGFREIAHFPCGVPLYGKHFDTYLFRKILTGPSF